VMEGLKVLEGLVEAVTVEDAVRAPLGVRVCVCVWVLVGVQEAVTVVVREAVFEGD